MTVAGGPYDLGALETALNETLAKGRLLDAYATYYDERALRGLSAGTTPDDRDRYRVLAFFSWAERFHGLVPARSAAGARVSRSEWVGPAPPHATRSAPRRRVVTRRWRQGRVVGERIEDHAPDDRGAGIHPTED